MKFPYMKLSRNVYRPILPFTITYQKSSPIKYFGLVDSGADCTYVAGELANVLGIKDIKTGREEFVTGIGGRSKAYFHTITISIGGWNFDIEAGFSDDSTLTSLGYGLLGQVGLFDNSTVKFSRKKFEFEIVPNPSE